MFHKTRVKFALILAFCAISMCGLTSLTYADSYGGSAELYRIEVYNKVGGQIAVSKNRGSSWEVVGRVLYPCQSVNTKGYTASKWAKAGAVAASAVNAIHIKTDDNIPDDKGVVFSLVPVEMLNPPGYYNSFLSPDSSIYTDIHAGTSIFGGGYSPYVGNPVVCVDPSGETIPVNNGYVPKINDIILIKVLQPIFYPKAIVFENRFGGPVKVIYLAGEERVIGEVLKPVEGVGRFQGSQFTGVGRIRANHTGVIDVSTSPMNKTGGFQIIPSNHAMSPEMGKARTMTQWMIVGPVSVYGASLEGRSPLFSSYLQPRYAKADIDSPKWLDELLNRFIVDVKLEGSDSWQPMPSFFLDPDLSKTLPEWSASALKDVTHIRILFPVERN